MAFKTEFEFTLPKGFVDDHGNLHRKGVMRLATAKDEIIPLQDFRVKNNRAYLVIILLNDAGEEALRYNLFECWPTKYHGPALNSRNSAHATESIELAFEGLEMK